MGYVVSLLSRLDAAIQHRFDSVCFFLMRRFGMRKLHLRYALLTLVVVSAGSCAWPLWKMGNRPTALAMIVYSVIWLNWQRHALGSDTRSESRGEIRSVIDAVELSTEVYGKIAWLILGLFCVGWLIVTTDANTPFLCICLILHSLGQLALVYLAKTPMNPPAEKAQEHVGMPQPTPAKS